MVGLLSAPPVKLIVEMPILPRPQAIASLFRCVQRMQRVQLLWLIWLLQQQLLLWRVRLLRLMRHCLRLGCLLRPMLPDRPRPVEAATLAQHLVQALLRPRRRIVEHREGQPDLHLT
jgi:hypothetical protein